MNKYKCLIRASYKPIDSETLLVERTTPEPEIHYSFYDSHVMNLVEDDAVYSGSTITEISKKRKNSH